MIDNNEGHPPYTPRMTHSLEGHDPKLENLGIDVLLSVGNTLD